MEIEWLSVQASCHYMYLDYPIMVQHRAPRPSAGSRATWAMQADAGAMKGDAGVAGWRRHAAAKLTD